MATELKVRPGLKLETVVARIQQMMDPNSRVTHNEKLVDRVGNKRQYDVVIRGTFGGRPVLGVIECKDHKRKKGPSAVEAFAKKTDNLGANLRLMVSKRGFTEQALKLAAHENIGCLSLLPSDPKQAGFSIGEMWYGVIRKWSQFRLVVLFDAPTALIDSFDGHSVKYDGKQVIHWFERELISKHGSESQAGEHTFVVEFDQPHDIEIEGKVYEVKGIACIATRECGKKRIWAKWPRRRILRLAYGSILCPDWRNDFGRSGRDRFIKVEEFRRRYTRRPASVHESNCQSSSDLEA